jgi:transcriptional regulator with XRE-family HTH domain
MTLQQQTKLSSVSIKPLPPLDVSLRFGRRVRALRQQSGRTQVQLSDYLGIDRTFLSDLERGKKSISLSYIETIAQGFGLSLSQMMIDI